jgi:ATP-dependent Clp protease ATP-binding subunit ClpB
MQSTGSNILAHPTACTEDGVVTQEARQQVIDLTSEYFPPELLNRLDTMLVFNKLSRGSILQVVALRLQDVAARLRDRRIMLDVDNRARNWLAEKGHSNVYGARAIARVVRTDVLFPLAQKLLRGTIRHVFLALGSKIADLKARFREGDSVTVRVSPDESALVIQENHPPDPEAGSADLQSSLIDGHED